MEDDNHKLNELKSQLNEYIKQQEELSKEKHYYDFVATLLKDTGIKTKIIKQYLPVMNKLINKYLASMDFFVNFNINENFEETIKSRHRDDFSYASFSEGEKLRIDLSLLFAWRQIAKMKNSTNTNLLILDEVFDTKNPLCWNKQRAINKKKDLKKDSELVHNIYENVINGVYPKKMLSKQEVKNLQFKQCRQNKVFTEKVLEIADQIGKNNGNTIMCDPLIILEERTSDGKHLGINPWLFRILFLFLGGGFWIYLLMWIFIEEEL